MLKLGHAVLVPVVAWAFLFFILPVVPPVSTSTVIVMQATTSSTAAEMPNSRQSTWHGGSAIADCESQAEARFPPGDPSMSSANSTEIEQAMRLRAYVRTIVSRQLARSKVVKH